MKKIYLTFTLMMLMLSFSVAQDDMNYSSGKNVNNFDIGFHLGLSNSGTDTHSWGRHGESLFAKSNLSYGINLKYHFSDALAIRLNYFGTKMSGDEKDLGNGPCRDINGVEQDVDCHEGRGYSFTSPLHEVALELEWEPFASRRYSLYSNDEIEEGLRMGKFAKNSDGKMMRVDADGSLRSISSFKKIISPFLTAGIGFSYTDPIINFGKELNQFQKVRAENDAADFTNMVFQIPLGAGLRFDFSEKIYADVEVRSVIPSTDLLDGMADITGINDPHDRNGNDSYINGSFRIGIRLGGDPDTDGDGIKDKDDSCPLVPGNPSLNGCPDADGDGVTDRLDSCPDVAGLSKYNGCPDTDGDGIVDSADRCPDTKGLSQYYGCPDTDGDGIIDNDDECPNEAGLKEYNGCKPADRDNDGVADDADACPDTPGDLDGCPDSDGDGISDNSDKCPNVKGTVLGCPDGDGDGIMDSADKCPTQKGTAANNGCPNRTIVTSGPSTTEIERINFAMRDIKFVTDSDGITNSSSTRIDEAVTFANSYPSVVFLVAGYTDSIGDASYNQRLSERRAKKVYETMIKRGVDVTRLRYAGFGEESPIADNNSKSGRADNRRVEISVVGN